MAITALRQTADTRHKWRSFPSTRDVPIGHDRRREERIPTSGTVRVKHTDIKETVFGMIHDISSNGARIRLMPFEYETLRDFAEREAKIKQGDKVTLEQPTVCDIIHRDIQAEVVKVVRLRQTCFVHLKFIIKEEDKDNLWVIMRAIKRQNKLLTAEDKENLGFEMQTAYTS